MIAFRVCNINININELNSYCQNNALTVPFLTSIVLISFRILSLGSGESGNQKRHYTGNKVFLLSDKSEISTRLGVSTI